MITPYYKQAFVTLLTLKYAASLAHDNKNYHLPCEHNKKSNSDLTISNAA